MEAAAAATTSLSCIVGLCSLLALYLYHVLWRAPQRLRAALRSQGIVGPTPSFPYGNLADIRQATAAHRRRRRGGGGGIVVHDYRQAIFPFYEQWRNKYGPVFSYSIGNMVFLHATRADVVRDLSLCVSALDLGKSSYMKETHRPLFGDGILKSSGDTWAHQRKILAPEFFPDKVRTMVGLIVDSATSLVKAWEDRMMTITTTGGGLELRVDDDLRAFSADVISRTLFGSKKGERVFAAIRELQSAVAKPNLLAEMTGLSSFLWTRSNREARRLTSLVRGLILDAVREGDNDTSLLGAMLRGAAGDEDFVVDNCKNIYFAGYETTAVTAAWCMMLLALHPDWQEQVRVEVRQAYAAALDFASLQRMKKLTMVIQETLRLYPAGSVVSRQALRDVTLGGVLVPAGVNIYVPISTLHLDPELWGADAREFHPERFAPGARQPAHAYLTFGAGARTCLGQGFAMAELKVLLALVISRFRLSLSPEYHHSPTLKLIVEPEHGVRLVLRNLPRAGGAQIQGGATT